MRVLTGDIGGTNLRLALAEAGAGGIRLLARRQYRSAEFDSLAAAMHFFFAEPEISSPGPVASACLAVAGPLRDLGADKVVRVTNLPWEISAATLRREFGISGLHLINDFQAIGYGIEALGADDVATLQTGGSDSRGVRAVIGAGTGLGQTVLVWQGDRYEALPTEGGHVDFAPTDEVQVELWRFLRARFERVGVERILCGAGLGLIYEFLANGARPPGDGDPAAAVTAAALAGRESLAARAVELFVRIYGAQAGNLALSVLATGGIYLAGGIAPRILDALKAGFVPSFRAKGRLSYLLADIPVRVILNPDVGLLGAAAVAARAGFHDRDA